MEALHFRSRGCSVRPQRHTYQPVTSLLPAFDSVSYFTLIVSPTSINSQAPKLPTDALVLDRFFLKENAVEHLYVQKAS